MKEVKEAPPVALVTGGAARIGAEIVRLLHARGYNILLNFNHSQESALALAMTLNTQRDKSVHCLQADLLDMEQLERLAREGISHWGRVDVLVNNASCFYPTPLGGATENDWNTLMGCNARAPLFLVQALAPALRKSRGCVVNLIDIYARGGLREYSIYAMSKAALANMTRGLARELAPDIRVNGIAPGAILWPEPGKAGTPEAEGSHEDIIENTCLKRMGETADIARAVWFLVNDATYVTGQVINVDGGRSLMI